MLANKAQANRQHIVKCVYL
uniref:Uncharacterized protein n=1 Tax=Anguilla anguilla TaxID=7936 RepID=A0A0E9QP55_ANGAN